MKERLQLEEMDKRFLELSAESGQQHLVNPSAVLPSVLMDEFCAFVEKYQLPLTEAGCNALRIASDPDFCAGA